MADDPIKVDGLKKFNKQLKQIDTDLPKQVRLAANKAAQIVVDEAQPRVPTRSGRAKASIRTRSTRTSARVSAGNKRVPYYGWLDFGGRVGKNRSVSRPFRKTGRYIWKAYDDNSGRVYETFQEALIDVARKAGFEVHNG